MFNLVILSCSDVFDVLLFSTCSPSSIHPVLVYEGEVLPLSREGRDCVFISLIYFEFKRFLDPVSFFTDVYVVNYSSI